MAQKDLLTRLADAGEEAIQRLASVPGTDQVLGVVTSLRDRMDEMQRRVRGIDSLERRVTDLERRLDAMGGAGAASTTAQTGEGAPPLSTGASVGAAVDAGRTTPEHEPPIADVEATERSGAAGFSADAAAEAGGTTVEAGLSAGAGAGDPLEPPGPSVGATAQMSAMPAEPESAPPADLGPEDTDATPPPSSSPGGRGGP